MNKNKDEMVSELFRAVGENGLIETLHGVFGRSVRVGIAFSKQACETSIDELDFSVRAANAMKRVGVFSVGEVVDLIAADGLLRVRNLGKKTQNEIKTRILAFGYACLSEQEQRKFLGDMVARYAS